MQLEFITENEFAEAASKANRRGQLQQILDEIEAANRPAKVQRSSRGSVAALVRAAKERGLEAVGDYKNLVVYIKPQ